MTLPLLSVDIIILAVIFSVLATVVVASRFWARVTTRAGFGIDDYLIIAGLVDLLLAHPMAIGL